MVEKLPKSHANVLGYRVGGNITEDDVKRIYTEIESLTKQHDQIRLLVHYDDLSGIDIDALDEDLRLMRFMGQFERMAVVSDQRIYDWVTSAYDKVATETELRHFDTDQLGRAWDWLE